MYGFDIFSVVWRLECKLKRIRKKRFSVEIPGHRKKQVSNFYVFCIVHFNPLNSELNPICHLLALLGGATIVVV